ncbi:hypothetical protein [Prevotellamassilia timonensis]|uniref:hypothetical protein n=1 Tax=Prevotellamassilia timonensis TaxID=1852370 RepID=UPI00307917AC
MSEGDKGTAQTKAQHELGKEIDFPTKTTYSTNKGTTQTKAQHKRSCGTNEGTAQCRGTMI